MFQKLSLLTLILIAALGLVACAAPVENVSAPAAKSPAVESLAAVAAANAEEAAADQAPVTEAAAEAVEAQAAPAIAAAGLSAEESAGLLWMREEEKLAHDVYLYLYEAWGLPVFQNIAGSEQAHTESVLVLLERYGLDDPAAGKAAGVFSDPELQQLYDQLTAQGSQSLADALKVGAAIEEIDILDLQERAAQVSHADIQLVYQNLERGSNNHLRAFTSTLQRQTGETYQPQYLSADAYQQIVAGTNGNGANNGGAASAGFGGRGGRGGRGGGRP